MLKKESFFQYLFVQSIGQSTNKVKNYNKSRNKAENDTVLKIKNLVNEKGEPQFSDKRIVKPYNSEKNSTTLIELKPIKIKSVKSQTLLLLFNKNIPKKTKSYCEIKNQLKKKHFFPTVKSDVNTPESRSPRDFQWDSQSAKSNNTRKLKISQNIFLVNKELKKVYGHNALIDNFLKKDTNVFLCSEKMGERHSYKNQNKKEQLYNVFLTYKKSFLSYWLLPFLGIISLTNSSLGLIRIGQDDGKKVSDIDAPTTREAQHFSSKQKVPNLLFFDKQKELSKTYNTTELQRASTTGVSEAFLLSENILNTRTPKNNNLNNIVHTEVVDKEGSYSLSILSVNQSGVESYKKGKQYKPVNGVNYYLNNPNNNYIQLMGLKDEKAEFKLDNNGIKLKTLFFKLFNIKYNSDFFKKDKNNIGTRVIFDKTLLKLMSKPEKKLNFKKLNMEVLKANLIKKNTGQLQWFDFILNKNVLISGFKNKTRKLGPNAINWGQPTQTSVFPNKILAPHLKVEFNKKPIQTKKPFLEILDRYTTNKKLQLSTSENKFKNRINVLSRSLNKNNIEQARQYFVGNKKSYIKRTPTFSIGAFEQASPQQRELPLREKVESLDKVLIGISRSGNMKRLDSNFSKKKGTKTKEFSIQERFENLETPEKCLKKASFLLDYLVLNNDKLNTFIRQNPVLIENIIKTNNLKTGESFSSSNMVGSLVPLKDATEVIEADEVLALDFVKSSRKLNETLVLLLKNKKLKDLKKPQKVSKNVTLDLKPQSLNNRYVLYNNIFEGLKNSINLLYLNNTGTLCDSDYNMEPINNIKDKVLKLNQPLLGGSLAVLQNVAQPVSLENSNNKRDIESISSETLQKQLTNPMSDEKATLIKQTIHTEQSRKNKINLTLTKLPIVETNMVPTNLIFSKSSEGNNEKFKNLKGGLSLSNNNLGDLNHIMVKQQKNKQNDKVRVDPILSIFNDYIKTLTKRIKESLNPYKNQIGLTYLWEKNSMTNFKNLKRFDTPSLSQNNADQALTLQGIFFRNSKNKLSYSPARFERIFLSYLSKTKQGTKKFKGFGEWAHHTKVPTVKNGFSKNPIKLGKQYNVNIDSILRERAKRVHLMPLKIKKVTENVLLVQKLKNKKTSDAFNGQNFQNETYLKPLFKEERFEGTEPPVWKTNRLNTSAFFLESNNSTIKPTIKKTLKSQTVKLRRIGYNKEEGVSKWNQVTLNNLGNTSKMFNKSHKSFLMFMKNRIFVNKKQNNEYWGVLTKQNDKLKDLTAKGFSTNKVDRYITTNETSKIHDTENRSSLSLSNASINETRRKKKQLKLKRRLKKMQCATRRRKKRKIFYPRPKWLTFTMYNNFLNTRFIKALPNNPTLTKEAIVEAPLKSQTFEIKLNLMDKENGLTTPWLKTAITLTKINKTKQKNQLEGTDTSSNNSKDFYRIAPAVSRELRRILMKSNWLRNYLNPYLDKIKNIYKELEMDSKNLDFFKKIHLFIELIYAPSHLEVTTKLNATSKTINESILQFEYNRIIYQRIQRIILNIRDNLTLNGQFKNQSQKIGKNIRPFIKRDYIKRVNNMTGAQNENMFAKNLKRQIINFSRNFILLNNGYEEPTIYATNQLSSFVQNNFYWALNRTERLNDSNSNASYLKKLWEKYKIREINKNNKTKKMIFNIFSKYNDLLNDQSVLDSFNLNLETDYMHVKNFYKRSPSNIKTLSHKNSFFSEYNLNQIINNSRNKRQNQKSYNTNSLSELIQSASNFEKDGYYVNAIDKKQESFDPQNESMKIKKALIATKTYIDKTEKKLINIEKKLKLIGLSTNNFTKPSYLAGIPSQKVYPDPTNLGGISKHEKIPFNFGSKTTLYYVNARSALTGKKDISTKGLIKNKSFSRITPLSYKKIYFRFLKQELLKESNYFLPYNMIERLKVKNAILRQHASRVDEALASGVYLQKLQKTYYNIKQKTLIDNLGSQQNLSGIMIANNIQNYSKFSSNTYWWTKNQIHKFINVKVDTQSVYSRIRQNTKYTAQLPVEAKLDLLLQQQKNTTMPLVQTYGLENRLSKQENNNYVNIKMPVPLISFLFHFCTLITLISIGSVRSVIKFYYILLSKIYKILNQLRFTNFFPTKVQKSNFTVASKQQINNTNRAWRLTNIIEDKNRTRFGQVNSTLSDTSPVSITQKATFIPKPEITRDKNKHNLILSQSAKSFGGPLIKTFKTIKLIALNYLLANPIDRAVKKQTIASILGNNQKFFLRGKARDILQEPKNNLDELNVLFSQSTNKISNNLLVKQETKKELVLLINAYLKTKKLTFQVKQTNKKGTTLPFDQATPLLERSILTSTLEKIKIKTVYDSNKKISMGLNTMYKLSFYTYILLLKSVDILMAPAFLIYKFFEKPGEYVVENIAYSFLLEWSADLISTIPDSIDPAFSIYINKLERNLPLYLTITTTRQNIFSESFKTINNLVNKTSPTKNIESIFGFYLLAVSNSIIRRIGNASILLFTQQITEPDLDYINRQKKGIIFWDLWGESLKTIAEKNSVNIYELSTDKEEQLKLLSNMQNLKSLNGWSNYSELTNRTGTLFERAIVPKASLIKPNFIRSRTLSPGLFSLRKQTPLDLTPTRTIAFSQRWAVNQFLNYQGKDTDLFIDLHPPRSFSNTATSLKYAFSIQAPIGSLVCQIFGGIFYKQISKNILVVLHKSSQTVEKSLLIQAIAGETELKIITDNAHRYAMVIQGVAVGIKLLKDVFEALCATGPCIFLLEDIHAIGERRPFLIDEASPNLTESIYNKNQSMQGFLLKEKSNASREILYKTNKHLLTNYKKPYKEFKSLASNHFSFTFLYRAGNFTNLRLTKINTADVPLPTQVSKKDKENQDNNLGIKKDSIDTTNSFLPGLITSKSDKSNKTDQIKVFGTFSELLNSIKNKQSLINPPASSPFNLLLMKESSKLKPNQTVKEMAWFGLPGEQYSLLSKYNFSIRVKVALLADSVLSNLSVKLEMITDLLVIIDSVKGNRGFIIFATTHLPDILDPALRRPGRFDETLSLPFIPALYSRWTNYRYNVKYLNSSLFKQYSISLNSFFNKQFVDTLSLKGISTTTLDFSNYPACYNDSQMEAVLPIYSSLAFFGRKTLIQKRSTFKDLDIISTTSITNSKINNINKKPMATLITESKNNDEILSVSNLIKNLLHFSYTRATSYASNTIISLMLYTSQPKVDELAPSTKKVLTTPEQLKWPTMLKDTNLNQNFLENYTNYLSLFGPLHFNKTSIGQVLLMSFITYKFGEIFGSSTKMKKQKSPSVLLQDFSQSAPPENLSLRGKFRPLDVDNKDRRSQNKSTKEKGLISPKNRKGSSPSTTVNLPFLININKNTNGKIGGQSATRFAPASLLSNYLQKRLPYITSSKNLKNNLNFTTFYSNHLLNFNNQYSLMEPPSPPITNILLPAKRYENYRRTFKSFHNLLFDTKTVSQKLKLHQQQRLLKRLYNYPIKEFFRNDARSALWFNQNTSDSLNSNVPTLLALNTTSGIRIKNSTRTRLPKNNFTQSYFIFAGIENFIQKNMASLNQFSSIDYSYRNLLYNRHKTYLTNQWWNGQQGEHNLESTFLSDIDWRYTQINRTPKNNNISPNKVMADSKSIHDVNRQIQVDFPDCEQYYNPRNRRWFLTKGDWNYWFNLNTVTGENSNEIYMHYIYESLTKAFKNIDQNREFLDFYSAKLLSTSFNLLNVMESQSTIKQTHLKTKSNISFEDLKHRNILNLYKRFYKPSH